MNYEAMAHFAQTWGMIYFILIFAGAVAYIFWPSNRKKFDDAANSPFNEELD
ncbi:MAG: CcoQ/FixQ family Cbb3-type cytochrome c oxidase assembly chaperone [Robiginitomaculum sp.]|nr:MAG: CcoQ/FixQ family Cbb3-type cytochrome c oxidase assembly chaperone [Robiginitomaculum sp.]